MMVELEPIDHVHAMEDDNWQGAMNGELNSIEKNKNTGTSPVFK